jgi:hypothetical protein
VQALEDWEQGSREVGREQADMSVAGIGLFGYMYGLFGRIAIARRLSPAVVLPGALFDVCRCSHVVVSASGRCGMDKRLGCGLVVLCVIQGRLTFGAMACIMVARRTILRSVPERCREGCWSCTCYRLRLLCALS